MNWIDALKQWNSTHPGPWMIPRAGTKEHAEIVALMIGKKKKMAAHGVKRPTPPLIREWHKEEKSETYRKGLKLWRTPGTTLFIGRRVGDKYQAAIASPIIDWAYPNVTFEMDFDDDDIERATTAKQRKNIVLKAMSLVAPGKKIYESELLSNPEYPMTLVARIGTDSIAFDYIDDEEGEDAVIDSNDADVVLRDAVRAVLG